MKESPLKQTGSSFQSLYVERRWQTDSPEVKKTVLQQGRHRFQLAVKARTIAWIKESVLNSKDDARTAKPTLSIHTMSTSEQQWIGIDISQTCLDVAVHPLGVGFRVAHTAAGRSELGVKLAAYEIAGIVLEATGGLERSVMADLEAAGYETRRVNPTQVRHFAKSMGKRAKTDRIDAEMIARYGHSRQPDVTVLPDAMTRQMQALVTRRQQVVEMLTMEKNRTHSCESWAKPSVTRMIASLEAELETLETQLAELSDHSAEWQERLAILTSVKGIGTVTSQALLVYLPELGHRSSKTIAALVGVAPFNHDSGKFKGKRRIAGGRKDLRSLLYMATMSAVQHNPVFRDHYQQLLKRGKAKRVALVACLRKLIVRLNAMLRDRQPWQDTPPATLEAVT